MSGRAINDHSFWAGAKGKASVFPDGPHQEKMESSAESAGSIKQYEDTTERIRGAQVAQAGKAKSLPMKPGYRN